MISYWKLLTTPLTPATSGGHSTGGASCTSCMVAASHTPPLFSRFFLSSISSLTPIWTPWTSIPIACASSSWYYGPTGTVLPLNLVCHGPAVQHVQPTTYRIPMEFVSWKNTQLRSPVEYPSRRTRQCSPWSRLQPCGSRVRGDRLIHANPSIPRRPYDSNIRRPT